MAFQLPSNEQAPHQAMLLVRAFVYETLPTGELSGRSVHTVEETPLVIRGADRHICIRKLNEVLEELKKLCLKT